MAKVGAESLFHVRVRPPAPAITDVIEPPGIHVGPLVTLHIVTEIVSEVAGCCLTAHQGENRG